MNLLCKLISKFIYRFCVKKAVMSIANLTYRVKVEVFDKKGEKIYEKEEEGKSFVANFLKLLTWLFAGTLQPSVYPTDRNGNAFQPASSFQAGTDFFLAAPTGETNFGVLLGNHIININFLPSNTDSDLFSPVSTGWSFGGTGGTGPNLPDNRIVNITADRTFGNNTGSDQQVTETGLAVKVRDNANNVRYVLIAHDALPGQPVTVPAGGAIKITYTIQTQT
jgi:hypothetical protein